MPYELVTDSGEHLTLLDKRLPEGTVYHQWGLGVTDVLHHVVVAYGVADDGLAYPLEVSEVLMDEAGICLKIHLPVPVNYRLELGQVPSASRIYELVRSGLLLPRPIESVRAEVSRVNELCSGARPFAAVYGVAQLLSHLAQIGIDHPTGIVVTERWLLEQVMFVNDLLILTWHGRPGLLPARNALLRLRNELASHLPSYGDEEPSEPLSVDGLIDAAILALTALRRMYGKEM